MGAVFNMRPGNTEFPCHSRCSTIKKCHQRRVQTLHQQWWSLQRNILKRSLSFRERRTYLPRKGFYICFTRREIIPRPGDTFSSFIASFHRKEDPGSKYFTINPSYNLIKLCDIKKNQQNISMKLIMYCFSLTLRYQKCEVICGVLKFALPLSNFYELVFC